MALPAPPWLGTLVNVLTLMLVQSIFAGYSVFSSAAFSSSSLSPWVFALFRDVFGGGILLSVAYYRRPDPSARFLPAKEDFGHFLLLGLLGIWCAQGLSALAVSLTTSDYMSLVQPVQTVVAFIGAVVVGSEPFNLRVWSTYAKVGAVAITVAGAMFMVAMSSFSGSSVREESKDLPLGTAYLSLQILGGGLYPVAMRPMFARYDVIVAVAWAYMFGACLILLSVLTCANTAADWHFTPINVAAIAYSAVLSSALNYFLMAWVNKRSSPLTVAAFNPFQPIVTVILSWAVLGQKPSLYYYIGGGAVIAGLVCLTLSQYYELRQRQAGVAPPDPELKGDDYLELPAAVEVALLGSRGGGEGGASAPRARPAAAQPSLQ